jgi:hypothetical protein
MYFDTSLKTSRRDCSEYPVRPCHLFKPDMLPLTTMMRSVKNSNATTGTSLIIVVRIHTFKVVKTNVEPVNKSIPGSVETVEGSLFAIVDVGSREVDSDITCTLRMTDGELIHVLRHHLHRRRWYGIAFVQVTNDKKHDCYSLQAFADRRLRFFEIGRKMVSTRHLSFIWNPLMEQVQFPE